MNAQAQQHVTITRPRCARCGTVWANAVTTPYSWTCRKSDCRHVNVG